MSETVDACPECDTTSGLFNRCEAGFGCRECGARFETPARRSSEGNTNTQNGLAARLAKADAEEVRAE